VETKLEWKTYEDRLESGTHWDETKAGELDFLSGLSYKLFEVYKYFYFVTGNIRAAHAVDRLRDSLLDSYVIKDY
jgi:hypothetical protein